MSSSRARRYEILAVLVAGTIFATLFLGQPLSDLLADQNVRAGFFLLVMGLIAATVVVYGWRLRPGGYELAVWLGLAAVFTMFFLRLGMPERSHLMEYGVLAIFIHAALRERRGDRSRTWRPALLAFGLTFLVGVADEVLQRFLPARVFDPEDIVFNASAAALAIAASEALRWLRRRAAAGA